MRSHPYAFEPDKDYVAWVVSAERREYPSIQRVIRAIKLTLATPFVVDGQYLKPSYRMEAVVWWVVGSSGAGEEFLRSAGVAVSDNSVRLTEVPPRLMVRFGPSFSRSGYQPVVVWQPVPAGRYAVDPVIVADRPVTGITLGSDGRAGRKGCRTLQLGKVASQLLAEFLRHYPDRVSPDQLRSAVESWHDRTPDQTVNQAVHALKKQLKPLGFTISAKAGERGWALMPA